VTKTVVEYWHAGAAGFHIEDQVPPKPLSPPVPAVFTVPDSATVSQVFPKRCGHLDGKTLVPVDQFAQKVQRAADARDKHTNGQFIVCARTDARGVEGIEAVVSRSKAYIDAGADMIFPEGLATEEGKPLSPARPP